MSSFSPASQTSSTVLHPPWLNIARAAWIIMTVLAAAAMITGTFLAISQVLPACTTGEDFCGPWTFSREDAELASELGLPGQALGPFLLLAFQVPKIAFLAVAILIFARRSDDWMALLLSLMLALFALEGVSNLGRVQPLVAILYALVSLIFLVLPFIFPNGRLVPRWARWPLLPLLVAGTVIGVMGSLAVPVNDRLYGTAVTVMFGLWFVLAVYAVVYRYQRVSTLTERQQTKWVVVGILGTFIGFIPLAIITARFPPSEPSTERLVIFLLFYFPINLISYLLLPAGVAFAILRYRLWDIDVFIRRTLIYGVLTGLLALVYFGSVVLLQTVVEGFMGAQSPLVIVLSTLLIAALFAPLRRRVQRVIDRRFYRRKYNAQKVLTDFAEHARSQVDLEVLRDALAATAREALQPAAIFVWLKPPEPDKSR